MSKEDVIVVDPAFTKFEYQHLVTHHFNKLRARLYNVAETNGNETQAKAMKGLIRDFTDDAHLRLTDELDQWALTQGVINEDEIMPHSVLSSRFVDSVPR